MKAFCVFLLGSVAFGQVHLLSPIAEFDLIHNPPTKPVKSVFQATPNGLTMVTIGHNQVRFVAADLDGRILRTKSDFASVRAQIYSALLRPDGSFWLISSGPYNAANDFLAVTGVGSASPNLPANNRSFSGQPANYTEMDLYDATGEHLGSTRLLAQYGGPIAADAGGKLVLIGNGFPPVPSRQSQTVHFGNFTNNEFRDESQVKLNPPVRGSLPMLTRNGDLVFVDKDSGNMFAVSPTARSGKVARLSIPHSIRAAATDSDTVYLLSADAVLKADLTGQILATYRLQFRKGFEPTTLGVTGNSLYMADRTGHVARFRLN